MQPLWKTVRRFLKKLKIGLPYDPEIPLLGIYLKEQKHYVEEISAPHVHSSITYNGQDVVTT